MLVLIKDALDVLIWHGEWSAWEWGHSSGLSEVVNVFEDYYDLVDQFVRLGD